MAGPYFVCSGATGTGTGLSWVNACVSVPALMTAATIAGGEIIYVHNTHNYVAGATITWTLPESGTGTVRVLCVDGGDAAFTSAGASMGTTVGSLTTGASESTNGNFAFTINTASSAAAAMYVHGIQIKAGAAGNSAGADIVIGTNNGKYTFSACSFWTDSTNAGALIFLYMNTGTGNLITCYDCTFRFGATGQSLQIGAQHGELYNCSISASGTAPTTAITHLNFNAGYGETVFSGCDWSRATNVLTQATGVRYSFLFKNCTIGTPVTGTNSGLGCVISEFHACAAVDGTNGANILSYYREDALGIVQDDQTVYVTTGPAQGTQDDGTATSYSLKMTPSTLALPYQPLYTPWVWVKVASTGSKAISMKVADTEAAVLKNQELWLEVEYMGGAAPANSPQSALEGTFPLSGTYHDVTAAGSNLTDTGDAWTGIVETGTYTLSKTVTLDEQGYIRCRVALGKDTTNPVYVDCRVTVA